jgi:hypothetical protein
VSVRLDPHHRIVILCDIEHYSRGNWTIHLDLQDGLHHVLEEAADEARMPRPEWVSQSGGVSELALLPGDLPKYRILSDFLPKLVVAVHEYNKKRTAKYRIRLRLAVDHGEVAVNGTNFAGEPPIRVARLCNAPAFKRALANATSAEVAVIVSEGFYRDVIKGGAPGVEPSAYRKVLVQEKSFREYGWIHVPGSTSPPAGLDDEPGEPASEGSAGSDTYTVHARDISGAVSMGPGSKATQNFGTGG